MAVVHSDFVIISSCFCSYLQTVSVLTVSSFQMIIATNDKRCKNCIPVILFIVFLDCKFIVNICYCDNCLKIFLITSQLCNIFSTSKRLDLSLCFGGNCGTLCAIEIWGPIYGDPVTPSPRVNLSELITLPIITLIPSV